MEIRKQLSKLKEDKQKGLVDLKYYMQSKPNLEAEFKDVDLQCVM